jgi:flagellar hook protein FlgE
VAGTDVTVDFVADSTTSNFLGETGLSSSKSTSYELNQTVKLLDMVNYNDTDAIMLSGTAIDENGIMVATYSDGSILTQYVDQAQTLQWKYTTEEGVVITGDDVSATGSAIANSHFALELATMVNEEGLVSTNNNLWQWGPDVGQVYYGIAGEMSFGPIESGGYEESNVDIAHELSTMISAQRMIQMNSRVFSTASSVMETLAYLGQ